MAEIRPRNRGTPASPAVDETAPRFATMWAGLAYALCTLVLMYPSLGGRFLVSPVSDQFGGYAYREFIASALRSTGSFPLWNPYILGGLPVAAGHGDVFYPTFLLRLIMPVDAAMNLSFALHLFLAGLFTYGFLRGWRFAFFPALIGGLGYMLSGQVASLVSPGHDGKLYVSALAPLLLWMITLGVRDGRVWAWGVVALTTGLCVLSPHYQLTYYLGLLAAGYALYLAFRRSDGTLERRIALKRLGFAAAAAVLGLGIASIQFLPFFEYIPFSPREGGRGWEYATSYSMPPEELINLYLPHFSGIIDSYWGRNPLKLHSEYLGAALLMVAGAAFGTKPRRGFVLFWCVAAGLALLVAFGGHTPFYRLWYLLPMMKVVRAPSMIFFIVSLAAAALAAVGAERLVKEGVGPRYLLGWVIAALVVAVLASAGFFTAIAETLAPPQHADNVARNAPALALGGWRSAFFVLCTAGVLWLLDRGRVGTTLAGALLALVIAADLWSIDRLYFRFSPPARELYATDPAIDYVRQQGDSAGRVISFPLEPLTVPNDPFLNGDALMVHRLRTVTGHQGNELQRWVQLAGAKSPAIEPRRLLDPQFWRLANARYWYTNAEWPETLPELPGARFVRRVGPVTNSVGSTVYLYELEIPGAQQPQAWVAPVIVKAPPEPTLATVLDPRFDPRQAAIFDSSAQVAAREIATLPPPSPLEARARRNAPGSMTIDLTGPATDGSALIISENYYPAWNATVDGRSAPLARADFTLMGIPLPAGARRIEVRYDDRAYQVGRLLTLIALALTALTIAGALVVERRARE